jgi:hypothetical protein
MIGLLLALYPARWRQRYGEEFRAVLESRPLGPFDFADVLIGALDARLTRFRFAGTAGIDGGPVMMLRIGGVGAVFGGPAWFIGIAGSSAAGGSPAWMGIALAGTVGLLLALVGLSAFQAHREPKLAWAAFGIPALGTIVAIIGTAGLVLLKDGEALIGTWSSWGVWMVGLLGMLLGSIIFAVATYRADVLSRRAAQSLAATSVVVLVAALGLTGTTGATGESAALAVAACLASFAASWMWLGISALRRGPIRAIAPA